MVKNLYGHFFKFYDNGNLKQYCYYVGSGTNSSYIRNYSEEGVMEDEKGNPFVDYISDDKKNVELHFSKVFLIVLS